MWKAIPTWEEYYAINENGEVKNLGTGKLLLGDINNGGYERICLYHKPKRERYFRHRLVAELFIPNPEHLTEVNHIDGNKHNNNVSNLEWSNREHNEHEARRNGIKEYRPFQVKFKNGKTKNYEFAPQLAKEIGVTKRTILNYLQGKSQGYSKYDIEEIKYI